MKFTKIIKILSAIVGVLGLIILLKTWLIYGKFVMAANSIKQLNDHFYYMEFKGDYYLEEYLSNGGAKDNNQLAAYIENLLRGKRINRVYKEAVPLNTGCATISTITTDGKKIFGRNYDWANLKCAMIIKTNPKNGYKSISTSQLDFIGFGEDFKPDSFGNKYLSAAAIFVPLDGMNEKGLCISDLMAGDEESTNQIGNKTNVTTTLAIRGILDFCADVPEAINFLQNHNMNSVIGYAHHFAISDAYGRSVVVEYINNQMIVTETNAVTNHYICADRNVSNKENSIARLESLNNCIQDKSLITEEVVNQTLYDIRAGKYDKASKTWWRAIFNQHDLTVNYVLEENYNKNEDFDFKL